MSQPVMYMFGDRDPAISRIFHEPRFLHLVTEFFVAEERPLPSERPPFWDDAIRLHLLESDGRCFRAGERLVLIPAVAERSGSGLLRVALRRYVEIADELGSELHSAYNQTKVAKHFSWLEVSHSIMAGLFLDQAMGVAVLQSGAIARQPTGDTVIWAFQSVSAANGYGVCSIPARAPRRALYAELWHVKTRRTEPRLNHQLVEIMLRIAGGDEVQSSPKDLLYLKHLKLVRTVHTSLRLQIPAFLRSDSEPFLELLTAGARQLATDAILPGLAALAQDAWWHKRLGDEAYRHAAVRLILEHGIDSVIAANVCAPFPHTGNLPVEWGRWLWEEPEGPRTVMPSLAGCSRQGSCE